MEAGKAGTGSVRTGSERGRCAHKFHQGTTRGHGVGNAYEMMFIESVLGTDTVEGFWFVSSLRV